MNELVLIVFQVMILIMSVVIHEVSHGMAALWLGDPTAKYAGRLTLNPLRHLEIWGSLVVPILMITFFHMGFGWAKPVPYNPYNLRDQKYGPALVGVAGPLSNILIAIVFGIAARLIYFPNSMVKVEIISNFFSAVSGGGYTELAQNIYGSFAAIFFLLFTMIGVVNVFLAFFNLIPIPPLDGSKLLFSLLPINTEMKIMLEQFGFMFLLIILLFYSRPLGIFLTFMLNLYFHYILGIG
ncbi:site-2 protease family protein [Patescibacteria group bacterium]|nr:MAG: site-2 protease family protein [Patescibacteria group bacterium]